MALQWQQIDGGRVATAHVEVMTLRVLRQTLPAFAHITPDPSPLHACTDTQWYSQAGWIWREGEDLLLSFLPIADADYMGIYGEPVFTYRTSETLSSAAMLGK